MKNRKTENSIREEVMKSKPDNIEGILRQCGKQEDIISVKRTGNTKKTGWLKTACCIAAALVILAVGAFAANGIISKPVTVISLDVNPSIELKLRGSGRVAQAKALNDDAQKLLEGMELEGTDKNTAVNAIIGSMVRAGYLNSLSNSVLVTVEGKNASGIEKEIVEIINGILAQSINGGAVVGQKLTKSGEAALLAQRHGISEGKAQLVLEVARLNPLLVPDELAKLSINELNVLLSAKNAQTDLSKSGQASTKAYIGAEKALEIALTHAGVQKGAVKDIEVELDFKRGIMVYEVEFKTGGMEYEHLINAITGEIIEDKQKLDDDNDDVIVPENAINAQKARGIALEHAGVAAENVTDFEIDLDRKNGVAVYEVEFRAGDTEYDYVINAQTGEVISFKKKQEKNTSAPEQQAEITPAKAGEIAFEHAKVSRGEAADYRSKLENEDGVWVYEIEFRVGNTEYEYEIDAETGRIISAEKETKNETAQGGETRLTGSQAVAKALEHAGLKASQVKELECELDYEDGKPVYEIEFKYGDTEYEYEISAYDGSVVSSKTEKDD